MLVQLIGILCVLVACGALAKIGGTLGAVLALGGFVGFLVCVAVANHDAII